MALQYIVVFCLCFASAVCAKEAVDNVDLLHAATISAQLPAEEYADLYHAAHLSLEQKNELVSTMPAASVVVPATSRETPVLVPKPVAQEVVPVINAELSLPKGPLQAAAEETIKRNALFLAHQDIAVVVGGRMRQEGFHFDTPLTFRSDYLDRYTFQRSKINLDIDTVFGKKKYGKPAVESHVRVTAFNVWDNFDVYSPIVEEKVAFDGKVFLGKADIDEHQHDSTVTFFYLEDGLVKVHFDALLERGLPCSLTIGYFPYSVGRGVSLGDYFGGAINYLGWKERGDVGNTTQRPGGILFSLGDEKSFCFEAYYSKWKKLSQGPDFTRKEIRAKRLDRDRENDPKYIQRGYGADRDLFAAKARCGIEPTDYRKFSLRVEPYGVYVSAPELEVELEGDASAKIGTVGCMLEWQKGGWTVNVEAACQMGYQQMHAIDRNRVILGDAYYEQSATGVDFAGGDYSLVTGRLETTIGTPAKYQSHVLLGITDRLDVTGRPRVDTGEFLPYRAYYVSDEYRAIDDVRGVQEQGKVLHTDAPTKKNDTHKAGQIYVSRKYISPSGGDYDGFDSQYSPYQFKSGIESYDTLFGLAGIRPHGTLYNADIPFAGGRRFRDAYRLDCHGYLMMADIAYTFPNKRLTIAAAAGYVSGADYPFNEEKTRSYNGFIPFRDANYEGRLVKSYAVLAARKIARPSSFSDTLMYAPNNFESITNLKYVGFGCVWAPLEKKESFSIEMNGLYFWEAQPPFKWDSNATRNFGSSKINGIWQKAIDDLHFTGYQTTERASKNLGLELNAVLAWRPITNLEIRVLFATFIPGQLYKDIKGTPNAYAIRLDADGDYHFDSLGSQVPFGAMFRVTYVF